MVGGGHALGTACRPFVSRLSSTPPSRKEPPLERTTFRPIRSLLLLLLALTALTVSALADNAPKPQLTVLVENPPQETYYLDLVAEGPAGEDSDALSWSFSDQEIADLDPTLLSALTAAVPEGYHACTVQGNSGAPLYGDLLGRELRPGVRSHYFFYTGIPTDYQILVVTESGETWLSPPCARRALQSSVTVDWEARTVTVPSVARSYLLQFLCTLLPTLLLEGVVLLLFGYRRRRSFLTFLWVNLLTQGAMSLYLAVRLTTGGFSGWILFAYVPMELAILLAELLLYRRFLPERGKTEATLYAVCANLISALLGWTLLDPLWHWILTLS